MGFKLLENIKIKQVDFYTSENDFKAIGVNKNSLEPNGKPKYVKFNDIPYDYSIAYKNAAEELFQMFKDCNSYEDARNVITTIYPGNLCSKENGCFSKKDTTGRVYCEWVVIWGDDKEKIIYWDVRWY